MVLIMSFRSLPRFKLYMVLTSAIILYTKLYKIRFKYYFNTYFIGPDGVLTHVKRVRGLLSIQCIKIGDIFFLCFLTNFKICSAPRVLIRFQLCKLHIVNQYNVNKTCLFKKKWFTENPKYDAK